MGSKTTRVQSITAEALAFSNADLLSSRIRNFKRMSERRILFAFGISYVSSAEQIERANQSVREAIEARPDSRFDRVHF